MSCRSTEPQAFDDDTIALAQAFAGYAAVALANVHLDDAQAALADHMQTAMAAARLSSRLRAS
jgi:GAF domain-containing protein